MLLANSGPAADVRDGPRDTTDRGGLASTMVGAGGRDGEATQLPPDQGGPVVVLAGGLSWDLPATLVLLLASAGAASRTAQRLAQIDHTGPGPSTIWGVLVGRPWARPPG